MGQHVVLYVHKGFTLMEMLFVIAIIAILIAIAIPVFAGQLERAREATDAANIRSAYAEVLAEAMTATSDATVTRTVTLTQTQDDWQNAFDFPGNLVPTAAASQPTATQTVTLTYDDAIPVKGSTTGETTEGVTIDIELIMPSGN